MNTNTNQNGNSQNDSERSQKGRDHKDKRSNRQHSAQPYVLLALRFNLN